MAVHAVIYVRTFFVAPFSLTVNEVSYVSNPASVEEQQGGAQQEASPSSASAGSDEGFTPQGTQQQLFVQPEGPPLGIDVSVTHVHVHVIMELMINHVCRGLSG